MRSALILALVATPLWAQDELPFDPVVIDQCLATGLLDTCIGMAARTCEAQAGPMARGLCLGNERAFWQARADAARTTLQTTDAEVQARATRRGTPIDTLEVLEATFQAYLTSACDWRQAQWDGVHSGFEWAECRMRLTAHHALLLEGWLDD